MRALAAFLVVVTGFFHAPAWAASDEGPAADITRQGDQFVVELHLDADAPEWVFTHSPAMLEGGLR